MSLVPAIISTIPFFVVRVTYTLLKAYNSEVKYFWLRRNVYVTSFMQFVMEAFIFTILVVTGLFIASRPRMGDYRGTGVQIIHAGGKKETPTQGQRTSTAP